MSLFFITFFLLYGGMHLYAFLKARAALAFGPASGLCIILFMLIMTFAPFIIRMSEKLGAEFFARLMSYIGYSWMGLLFLFACSALVIDIYGLLVYSGNLIFRRDLSALTPSAGFSFSIPLVLSVSIAIYGYFEALNIRTEKIIIETSKLPEEVGRLRIAQISDVHIGMIVREGRLKKILEEVKKAGPDLLISTGDLVDGQLNQIARLSEMLGDINPRYGKFAITGNHEFYAGISQSLDFIRKAGFRTLRAESISDGPINIAGVDDSQGKTYGNYKFVPEKELLSGLPRNKFTLLLKHKPLVDEGAIGSFDLQISGHVHKGQIFPFSLITWFYYPHHAGFANLTNNSYLYVSRGSGTWGPPIRFLSPPEVTLIEIVNVKKQTSS